jgi:very-short-patch-repair endonuclease
MSSPKYDKLTDNEKTKYITQYYVEQKLSFADIAQKLDTYPNKIRRDAKKLNISIRSKSDAQKNALSSGKHKHPTKGTERDQETKNKIGLQVLNAWASLSESELDSRRQKSKAQWDSMTEDQKALIRQSANNAVRNASKTGSKLEKFLLNKLLNNGYRVEFHKEQMLSNTKLHIDLFLPTMNIAIEVDGPSHFEPVWGDDALVRNQRYDTKKNGLLVGKGIKLLRVKQTKDFSNARASIIYERLVEAINTLNNSSEIKSIEIGDA